MDDFELETLDDKEDDWLNKIYENEKELDKYYKNNILFVCLNCIYIDIDKNIIKIKKENIEINNNFLSKQNILNIINKNNKICKKEFKIFSIGKYNFNIDIENINKYNNNIKKETFFESLKSIKDIYWLKTIPIFEKLNSLYLFFIEKSDNKTKKNYNKKNYNKKNYNKNKTKNKTKKLKIKELYTKDDFIKLN
tara:strand:- start:9385 stop:9966 length:582 start_codon:yes stop_codon:yes gene_type:complete